MFCCENVTIDIPEQISIGFPNEALGSCRNRDGEPVAYRIWMEYHLWHIYLLWTKKNTIVPLNWFEMPLVHNWSSLYCKMKLILVNRRWVWTVFLWILVTLMLRFLSTSLGLSTVYLNMCCENMLLSLLPNGFHLVSQMKHWVAAGTRLESPSRVLSEDHLSGSERLAAPQTAWCWSEISVFVCPKTETTWCLQHAMLGKSCWKGLKKSTNPERNASLRTKKSFSTQAMGE